MILREEVIELAKSCGFGNADVCEGMFYQNFERFAAACYRKGVEDAIAEIDPKYYTHDFAKGVVEGCIEEIRALLEQQ